MISEDTINDIKSYYYVITSNLDNMELSHYLMKIPTTYFATFPYVEHYKQIKQQLSQLQEENKLLKEDMVKANTELEKYRTIDFLSGKKLQEENVGLRKGIAKLQTRKLKWKNRYYKERIKSKKLTKIINEFEEKNIELILSKLKESDKDVS